MVILFLNVLACVVTFALAIGLTVDVLYDMYYAWKHHSVIARAVTVVQLFFAFCLGWCASVFLFQR